MGMIITELTWVVKVINLVYFHLHFFLNQKNKKNINFFKNIDLVNHNFYSWFR